MCAGGLDTHLVWLSKKRAPRGRKRSGPGAPHPRGDGSICTFRTVAAAQGHRVRPGFGCEQKVMRPGIAALHLLLTGGLSFA